MAVASMSRGDKIKQMFGTPYGNAFSTQFSDIQRSQDTPNFAAGATATPRAA